MEHLIFYKQGAFLKVRGWQLIDCGNCCVVLFKQLGELLSYWTYSNCVDMSRVVVMLDLTVTLKDWI